MAQGTLIVIDGGDGAGKQTQTDMLVKRLIQDGVQVGTLDFPRYETNTMGALIRECLDGKRGDFLNLDPRITSTLYAVDRFETKPTIEEWLEEGRVVLLDRYVSSNMFHQGTKVADDAELKELIEWLEKIEFGILGLPKPDLNIYFHVDPEERIKMLQHAADKRENVMDLAETNLQHQKDTDETAQKIIGMTSGWSTIECMQEGKMRSRQNIHEEVYELVSGHIKK